MTAWAAKFCNNAVCLSVNGRTDGWPVRLYLLQKPEGSVGAAVSLRRYDRHWTPVHLDEVVKDVEAALARAIAAGAHAETEIKTAAWGKIVTIVDPFGHGLCLIEFLGRGYDEIAGPAAKRPAEAHSGHLVKHSARPLRSRGKPLDYLQAARCRPLPAG